ncbi:class I SAM-dependent methyltransferase [Peribacillus sp. SCS-37]|uniref:class I SAM-dependent methyltransferase n=1 Tax=Paraperibacillus esterisolvens TaxID=3115296 RepID=UPI003905AE94
MELRGSKAYDQKEFYSSYIKRRARKDSPNNAIEAPIIKELIGNTAGEAVLDLGCGDADFGRELLLQGAESYTGVEGSAQMAEAARTNLLGLNGSVKFTSMESFSFPLDTYDLAASRFALHYISDLAGLFEKIHQSLKDKGRFVFSVQHPLTTSSFLSKEKDGRRGSWIVDDYFIQGERKEPWMGEIVVKYHRTIEEYFRCLTHAGFRITDLREGTPDRKYFSSDEEYERRLRIPVVLLFSCEKI